MGTIFSWSRIVTAAAGGGALIFRQLESRRSVDGKASVLAAAGRGSLFLSRDCAVVVLRPMQGWRTTCYPLLQKEGEFVRRTASFRSNATSAVPFYERDSEPPLSVIVHPQQEQLLLAHCCESNPELKSNLTVKERRRNLLDFGFQAEQQRLGYALTSIGRASGSPYTVRILNDHGMEPSLLECVGGLLASNDMECGESKEAFSMVEKQHPIKASEFRENANGTGRALLIGNELKRGGGNEGSNLHHYSRRFFECQTLSAGTPTPADFEQEKTLSHDPVLPDRSHHQSEGEESANNESKAGIVLRDSSISELKLEAGCGEDLTKRRNLGTSSKTQFSETAPSFSLESRSGIVGGGGGGDYEVVDAKNDNQNVSMETQDAADCEIRERGRAQEYPVPLTPLSGEVAKGIEYERAMVAELAMKSGPALTRSGVLFEDEWLLVINKPCGIYSEHVLATAPSLLTSTTFTDNEAGEGLQFHMANRLDRDTSGVMVITKCRKAAASLSQIFAKRQVQKSYVALCRRGAGAARPSWTKLTVDSGHGRSRFGAWRVYSRKDVGRRLPGGSVVRDMTTHLLIVSVNKQKTTQSEQITTEADKDDCHDITYLGTTSWDEGQPCDTLQANSNHMVRDDGQWGNGRDEVVIRAIPLTGRTHQIRLHCQLVGLPLVGDVKYGGPLYSLNGEKYAHHALHAESLSFKHPLTSEDLNFVAPLPQWAADAGVLPLVR